MQNPTKAPNLFNSLDIDLALKRVGKNLLRGPFPNRLDAALLKRFPDRIKDRVNALLDDASMDWANDSAHVINLPRQDRLIRPISYVEIDAWVVYQALVDAVSTVVEPFIDSQYGDKILGHRLRGAKSEIMYRDPIDAYGEFIAAQHKESDLQRFSHCLKLDIASYYERIYHHKLHQLIERLGVPGPVTSGLMALLRKFTNGDSHGIPQGLWPSDYLGNVFLLYLDEFLSNNGVSFVRYVDDYRIFCTSERQGHHILKDACAVLREVGLNAQPMKTHVVTVDKLNPQLKPLTEQFLQLRTERIKVIIRQIEVTSMGEEIMVESEESETLQREAALSADDIRAFEQLWSEAVDQEDKRSSILGFALSGLTAGASPTARQYVLDNLGKFPHLASAESKYLLSLGFDPDTAGRILGFVESPACIYEWQEMWLLQYFRKADPSALNQFKSRLKILLADRRRHPLVRASISEILAFGGSASDGEDFHRLFKEEPNPRLRRNLLLGLRLLSTTERNYAIGYLPPNDWALNLVGEMVKGEVVLVA